MPDKNTVLVVEDTRTIRQLLVKCLEDDFIVLEAEDGEKAIELFKNNPLDVILLDVEMPGINGFETCARVRQLPGGQHIPIVMVTGLNDLGSITKAYEVGATDFMTKPLVWDIIAHRVRYIIRTGHDFLELQKKKSELNTALTEIKTLNQGLEQKVNDRTRQLAESLEQIKIEKQHSDELLHAIFPPTVFLELKETNKVQPRRYKEVAILFIDVVSFTNYCETHTPNEILNNLQELIKICEDASEKYNIQKIKTIGDAFMAMAIKDKKILDDNQAFRCIQCAKYIIDATQNLESQWRIHAGIHIGEVMGGVVGRKQYLFDIWGDTVNTAARIQQLAKANQIYLSDSTAKMVKKFCNIKPLGNIEMKGKSAMEIFEFLSFKDQID